MDATDKAKLRADAEKALGGTYSDRVAFSPRPTWILDLLDDADALEQARKERDELVGELNAWSMIAQQRADQRDAAQKDAKDARALAYEECAKVVDDLADVNRRNGDLFAAGELDEAAISLRARIEAVLEQKIDNKDYLPHIVSND